MRIEYCPYDSSHKEMTNIYGLYIMRFCEGVNECVVLSDDHQLLQSLELFANIVIMALYS